MGLLSGSSISNLLGRAFEPLYEDATIQVVGKIRLSNGTLQDHIYQTLSAKIQLDRVTEAMSRDEGYALTDQRAIILRKGLDLEWLGTDCRLIARGKTWTLHGVSTDPARSHFEARAALVPGSPEDG